MLANANMVLDGFLTLEQGVDSGKSPSLVGSNQAAYSLNLTYRGGFPTTRPGWITRDDDWESATQRSAFKTGKFQGAGVYHPDFGNDDLFASVSGRIYRFVWGAANTWTAMDVTPGITDVDPVGDPNPSLLPKATFCQAENFLLIQDDFSTCLIWDGSVLRRATYGEVPIGSVMTYGIGRLWVARGNEYVGGDIVGGPSGTEANAYRDSVIKFTENTYIAEGGAFSVNGNITSLTFVSDLDTATGEGFLTISTLDRVYTNRVPADRLSWKDFSEPIQKVIQLNYGAAGDRCVTAVNGDLYYRSTDGVRSLVMAIRRFQEPGNTPISAEVTRPIEADDVSLLNHASSVLFDNRLHVTVSPYRTSSGVCFQGEVVLDFDIVSGIRNKLPAAWEGAWSGPQILQLLKARINGVDRLFAFVRTSAGEIAIQERSVEETTDDGESISWFLETCSFKAGSALELKKLSGGDLWMDRIDGDVAMSVSFRPDQYPGWVAWHSWTECTTVADCLLVGGCLPMLNRQQGYFSRRKLPEPTESCNSYAGRPFRLGYEFQFKIQGSGHLRLRNFRMIANKVIDNPNGDCPGTSTCQLLETCAGMDL